MIFADTSALYAVLDRDDPVHAAAAALWPQIIDQQGEAPLLTSNYVLAECFTLIQRRLGRAALRAFHDRVLPILEVHWITPHEHTSAMQAVLAADRRGLSLVDCTSFQLMRRLGAHTAFTFDEDFRVQGFETLP